MSLLQESDWRGRIFSDGWTKGSGEAYPVVSPATGETLGEMGMATPADVSRAAARAAEAQRAWAEAPYTERAAVLRRAGDLWHRHEEEITGWLMRETGAIGPFGGFQVMTSAQECYEASALASAPYGELLRSAQPRLSLARRLPVGVVGVIAPFNVPTILAIRAVAPALALGNAVLLKPDPRTAVSGGTVIAQILAEAGLPDGVLHVLPGGADVGEALVVERSVRVIAFTGSTRAGRAVGALAAQHLKRVHLELGGNSALLVLDDVDPEAASSVGAWGSFAHQGQVCMTAGRHLVQSGVADAYVDALAARADRLPVGDPTTGTVALGPVIDRGQRDKIHELVTGTLAEGARLAAGGTFEDLYYRPTVLADVPTSSPAYWQEIFGPVAPVVRFDTVEEAVALANDSDYGLSLGILTRDVMRGLEIAARIPSGLVHINDQTVNDEATVPFGGVLDSGTGSRQGGAQANLDAFTDTQWVTVRGSLPTYPM
jgi:benzaldehyde dehydrogenase (NAD)